MSPASLHHVALWAPDLDRAAAFWQLCFDAEVGPPYHSARRPGFLSRFASLPSGLRIELMTAPGIAGRTADEQQGWDHIALALGSREAVDAMAARCEASGLLAAPPRLTGDGFYEAILRGPDGLRVEIMA